MFDFFIFYNIKQLTFKQIKKNFFSHQNFHLDWSKCLGQHEKSEKNNSMCYGAVNIMTFIIMEQMLEKIFST